MLRAFWQHTTRYPWMFGAALLGVVVQQIGFIWGPLYVRDFFNLITSHSPADLSIDLLLVPIIAYAVVQTLGWIGGRIEMAFGLTLITRVSSDLCNDAFTKLMHHSYRFFSNAFAGSLTRIVTRYGASYERLYYSLSYSLVPAALFIIGIITVISLKNLTLGLMLAGWCALFVVVQWIMALFQQPLRITRAQTESAMTGTIADSIGNHNTVALFSGNQNEDNLVARAVEKTRIAIWRLWATDWVIFGIQGLLAITVNVGLLWVGAIYWLEGKLTIGDLVLIQTYLFGLFNYIWGIGREFRQIYTSVADATEMIEIIETPHEVKDKRGVKKLTVAAGEVWFDDVSFRFSDHTAVLNDFNLKIAPGEKIALVGPSGAGKTTVTKLLLRLYDVKKGEIKIDGQNITCVTQDSLREAVGFVPQEPILFHRTLMENIRYGRRDATDKEVVEAARQAHCAEFIDKLPEKYGTFVGERGVKLSGGERQRVAIARAILKNAPILVLDEATSSLDSESEALIQDALEVLMRGKTVIVIAHRLSTIMKMDRIVVMQGGSIAAEGTHLELVNQDGLYRKLWSIQAGGFIGDGHKPEKPEEIMEEETDELARRTDGLAADEKQQ